MENKSQRRLTSSHTVLPDDCATEEVVDGRAACANVGRAHNSSRQRADDDSS